MECQLMHVIFFSPHGPFEAFLYEITFSQRPLRSMSLLINEMLLYLFAEFELHPSNNFREYQSWIDEYPFLNMIGSKLSNQRNARQEGFFKFTIQRSNFLWQPTAFQNQVIHWLVNLKWTAHFKFFGLLSLT